MSIALDLDPRKQLPYLQHAAPNAVGQTQQEKHGKAKRITFKGACKRFLGVHALEPVSK